MTEEEKKEYQRKYYQEHKEKILKYKEHRRLYAKNHKGEHTAYIRKYRDNQTNFVVYGYKELNDKDYCYIGSTKNAYERLATRNSTSKKVKFDVLYRERPDDFTVEIICECDTLQDARRIEKNLIEELHPIYNIQYNRGYNYWGI